MKSKKLKWFKIATTTQELEWQQNNMCIVEVNGKKITLAKHNETIYAVSHKCPHASGIMAAGSIDVQGNIICPLHRFKFNLITGVNTSGEGYFLNTYSIKQNNDGLFVGLDSGGLFGNLL